uniref:Uncharacterized protein n=1 Tax=Hordeum vulgare subsp. vulgare TaxID=112509 RepID=M0YKS2_HORVV
MYMKLAPRQQLLIVTRERQALKRKTNVIKTERFSSFHILLATTSLMGDGKESSSGFWSTVASCFRPPKGKPASTGGRTTMYDPAGGMVAAARHFSGAHKINFG